MFIVFFLFCTLIGFGIVSFRAFVVYISENVLKVLKYIHVMLQREKKRSIRLYPRGKKLSHRLLYAFFLNQCDVYCLTTISFISTLYQLNAQCEWQNARLKKTMSRRKLNFQHPKNLKTNTINTIVGCFQQWPIAEFSGIRRGGQLMV